MTNSENLDPYRVTAAALEPVILRVDDPHLVGQVCRPQYQLGRLLITVIGTDNSITPKITAAAAAAVATL